MVVVENPINEQMQKELDGYEDEFKETLGKITDMRKEGKDTKLVEIMVLAVQPKIKMVRVTWESNDMSSLKSSIDDLKAEIKSIEEGIPFDTLLAIVHDIYVALFDKKLKDATKSYNELISLYKKIKDPDMKKMVYPVCVGLHKRILDAKKAF